MRWRHVVRRLTAMPLFTGMAVLTLALGIGANTAIFSVVSGVLLKPLPYPRSDEIVALDHAAPGFDIPRAGAAPFLYFTYREEGRVFQDVAMWSTGTVSVTGTAQPEEVPALFSTDGLIPILGVQPMLGRTFSRADDAPGGPETVVLTAGYWRSKFGADPKAVGRTVTLDGKPREIIGVMPDAFRFLDRDVSLIVPFRLDRSKTVVGQFSYAGIARLKPGESIERARADAARLIPIALRKFPLFDGATMEMFEKARLSPEIRSLKDDLVGDVQGALWLLMGTIGMVLLIACANVANLLLVRAESRQQELTVKAALGASSGQIVRELLMESLTLAALGGIVGVGLASAKGAQQPGGRRDGSAWLPHYRSTILPRALQGRGRPGSRAVGTARRVDPRQPGAAAAPRGIATGRRRQARAAQPHAPAAPSGPRSGGLRCDPVGCAHGRGTAPDERDQRTHGGAVRYRARVARET